MARNPTPWCSAPGSGSSGPAPPSTRPRPPWALALAGLALLAFVAAIFLVWRYTPLTRYLDAQTLHLAHFGSYPQGQAHWDGLLNTMQVDAERVKEAMQDGRDFDYVKDQFTEVLLSEMAEEDPALPALYEFACPPWMSVQGLMRYWTRKAARSAPA